VLDLTNLMLREGVPLGGGAGKDFESAKTKYQGTRGRFQVKKKKGGGITVQQSQRQVSIETRGGIIHDKP